MSPFTSFFQDHRTAIAIVLFMSGLLATVQQGNVNTIDGGELFGRSFLTSALLVLIWAGWAHWRNRAPFYRDEIGEYFMLAVGVGFWISSAASYWNKTSHHDPFEVQLEVISKSSGKGTKLILIEWEGKRHHISVPWDVWTRLE
ncbi:MAG: hypothetical protein WA154_12355 [Moraxellaceae bacterium]